MPPASSPGSKNLIFAAGMANPMFCALWPDELAPATAVFIPITAPAASRSAPPEFPGLIAASVWIMLVKVSEELVDSLAAVTVRPSAETMPCVTVGVPAASPSALPMATVASPTWTKEEFPKTTGRRPVAPSILRSATSLEGSVPTKVAAWAVVEPDWVTVMEPPDAAKAITWLLVIT
jgi:hypothetical protein